MSGEVPTLIMIWLRDTKRFALYQQEGNEMNKLYFPQGLPKRIIYEPKAA